MISEIKFSPINFKNQVPTVSPNNTKGSTVTNPVARKRMQDISKANVINQPNTRLSQSDEKKYLFLVDFLKGVPKSQNSPDLAPVAQLDYLLKNGKLLSKSSHDNSTTLDNLYLIAAQDRALGLDKMTLLTSVLDILAKPQYVTQTFGDIPSSVQNGVLNNLSADNPIKKNPNLMNVFASGTCAAASIEVNMADKYPAEFARWVANLSSAKKSVELNVDLKAISKNPLEASMILNLLEANIKEFSFGKVKLKVDLDDSALTRAYVQSKYWDKGERNVADVIIQSAIMKIGSQNTYDALSDIRGGKFNSNPQGLIEIEKTFVESLIKNKEITSLVYQKIDDDQNLLGYNCSMDKIAKHITDTIDSGDDVILGYILTNEMAGMTKNANYNSQTDGLPNKVINGHEITVVDYYKDQKGKLFFVCVDTDDNNVDVVRYSADWLLPKIHHAGYPAPIVEADEAEIMKNVV